MEFSLLQVSVRPGSLILLLSDFLPMSRLKTLRHLFQFLMNRKRFWLAPILLILILLGVLLVFTQGTILAPFVYTLF